MGDPMKPNLNDPKEIVESNLSIEEKKLQIKRIKVEQEEALKKIKKEKAKKSPLLVFKPANLLFLFFLFFFLTGQITELALFLLTIVVFFKLVPLLLRGPVHKAQTYEEKAIEKQIK